MKDNVSRSFEPRHVIADTRISSGQCPRCDVNVTWGARPSQGHTKKRALRHTHVKKTSAKKILGIAHPEQKAVKNIDMVANRTLCLKGHLLVYSPECDRSKQTPVTVPHVLCDYEALATSRFRHLSRHSMTAGYFEDISASGTRTALCSSCGTDEWKSCRAALKIDHGRSARVTRCPPFCILSCSIMYILYIGRFVSGQSQRFVHTVCAFLVTIRRYYLLIQ
jgi:hypothetical protein